MRLRLYHHKDGARVAYREAGTGPPLVLMHSLGLGHREFEPVVSRLTGRFRVLLPDLPLHGDSEDRRRHPYSADWFIDVMAGFCASEAGPGARVGGHGLGAEIALRMVASGAFTPTRLVVMTNRLHRRGSRLAMARRMLRGAPVGVVGYQRRLIPWMRFACRRPGWQARDLMDGYGQVTVPVLLLWSPEDRTAELEWAQEARDLLPDALLRELPGTGFLVAYDDSVSLARELIAFCG